MLTARFGSATDTGNFRPQNEDSSHTSERLFVVADGMGGHNAGEIASALACSRAAEAARTGRIRSAQDLSEFVTEANVSIFDAATTTTGQHGMGTTITALAVLDDSFSTVAVANVGDSRTYLLRNGELRQVSVDHSYVQDLIAQGYVSREEARTHPQRNIVTRALGIDRSVLVDTFVIDTMPGDRFVLCSDGLVDEIDDAAISGIAQSVEDPSSCASRLVSAAKTAGGRDNITVVVVDFQPSSVPSTPTPNVPSVVGDVLGGLVVLGLFAVLVTIGVWRGAHRGYYVTFGDKSTTSQVVILHGKPGGIWWFDPRIEKRTTLRRSDLLPAFVADLDRIRSFDSLVEAQRFVTAIESVSGRD
jgi:protein phosphatase